MKYAESGIDRFHFGFCFYMLVLCMRLTIIVFFFCACAIKSWAQSKQDQPTALEPFYPQEDYAPKASKKKKGAQVSYNARDEFYDLQEEHWKVRAKAEKKLLRKQAIDYSLPPYFGHKKPVKIRPLGKRKYCKVCGIVH